MIRRRLVLALAVALLPATAAATDLLQTYELARQGDAQLSEAEFQRLATREGAAQARAQLLPQIGGEASYVRSRSDNEGSQALGGFVSPPSDTTSEQTLRRAQLSVQQAIFDGTRFGQLRSQRALAEASDLLLESAGDTLITRTSAGYFNVLVQLETLAAAEAAERALQKQFDFASKRLEVGLAPITDVHEARAQFDTARANTILARNAVEDAYQALVEITGQPITNLAALPEDFQPTLPVTQDVDEWVSTAVATNPSLLALQLQVRAAEEAVSAARAAHWPTLYASASYSDSNASTTQTNNIEAVASDLENTGRGGQIGLVLSVPIYSGGAIQSQVREAIARRDIIEEQVEQQKRALVRNTRNAYQTLVAGISEVEARRLALFSARSAYDASQVGLEVGTRTVLDVLTNQQQLFNAQQAYAQARYRFLQNRLLLEQAAGTLDVEDVREVNRLLTAEPEIPVAPIVP
ncbi:TolC family outer membrane protein [Cognatilysobacter bugurensis]|uniref:Membrane protein n=1 Tax=Cognatilysobacter bugurensis TaxID=543356 RepID=A0A918T0Z0_9GAMM|nr:TolC family outer membrane protein [Lysobacter bugurensis]GHA81033.1 membrane protein [Lysobacter bugurensis]